MSDSNPDPATSAAATVELQQLLLTTAGIEQFLQRLADLAVTVLPDDPSCGITLRRDRKPLTVASSDTRAAQLDEVQYGHQQGPCLTSLDTGAVIVVDDLATDERWGEYQMPALGHGVRASLSLPLRVDEDVFGAMNLYSTTPRFFGVRERFVATQFAEEASRALTLALRLAGQVEMSENLRTALASRAVIDQALGIIMGRNRCTADAAFDILRTTSQNRNTKLRDVAVEVVTAVSGEPPAPGPRFT